VFHCMAEFKHVSGSPVAMSTGYNFPMNAPNVLLSLAKSGLLSKQFP